MLARSLARTVHNISTGLTGLRRSLTFTPTNNKPLTRPPKTTPNHIIPLFLPLEPLFRFPCIQIYGPDLVAAEVYEHFYSTGVEVVGAQGETCDLVHEWEFREFLAAGNVEDVHGFVDADGY